MDEIVTTIETMTVLTGHRILIDCGMGLLGVEIDHDKRVIKINGRLDPPAFRWALVRAYRRIMEGVEGAPEFHAKLRLVS